ncbi:hypothetical protein TBLA_0E04790 [Henningerozyma blattae CBS 6284]|uniref:Uncharacterized protein n=1 Tax=Henningerozyma blattae (strain ATCC 34711 / CBS 6284 / DSM 70876 / NBRC 10599 / NRRL Y-10934 / UCD 77-7) TaxID=1071380 RepID=I2H579_HENB6|nr:hypothetical protein TBLA_0E04790 [Tetrapisispora blattae CBS 6284]CCH61531.1 hypothetical protein TBLA_0E04790 [Tetrapisispora blattae CBS 6284]
MSSAIEEESVQNRLTRILREKYAREGENCMVFPSYNSAKRCREYVRYLIARNRSLDNESSQVSKRLRILQLATPKPMNNVESRTKKECKIATLFFDQSYLPLVKDYSNMSGEIISILMATYVLKELFLVEHSSSINRDIHSDTIPIPNMIDTNSNVHISHQDDYLQDRYGRHNDLSMANHDTARIKRRLALQPKNCPILEDNHSNTTTLVDSSSNENYANTSPSLERQDILNTLLLSPEDMIFNSSNSLLDPMTLNDFETSLDQLTMSSIVPAEPIDGTFDIEFNNSSNPRTGTAPATTTNNNNNNNNNTNLNCPPVNISNRFRANPNTDIYLFPNGKNAIFATHRFLIDLDYKRIQRLRYTNSSSPINNGNLENNILINNTNNTTNTITSTTTLTTIINNNLGNNLESEQLPYKKTVLFGYSKDSTFKILNRYENTYYLENDNPFKSLEEILERGEQILGVYLEAPSSKTLDMYNLKKLKKLSNDYGFLIIIDESICSHLYINVLKYCDIITCDLCTTLRFNNNQTCSNEDVTNNGGGVVLNKDSKNYEEMKLFFQQEYKNDNFDIVWCQDIITWEFESREFIRTSINCDLNTLKIIEYLQGNSKPQKYHVKYPNLKEDSLKNYNGMLYGSRKQNNIAYGNIFDIRTSKDIANKLSQIHGISVNEAPLKSNNTFTTLNWRITVGNVDGNRLLEDIKNVLP